MTEAEYGPWNPGLKSEIPREILRYSTMFRPENIANGFDEVQELSEATGIPPFELVSFRPERLIAHEVLIRVTADLMVPDGPRYEDLGINLRGMVRTVLEDHVAPELPAILEEFGKLRAEVSKFVREEVEQRLYPAPAAAIADSPAPKLLARLLRRPAAAKPAAGETETERVLKALANWSSRAKQAEDPFKAACLDGLYRIVNRIFGTRGRLVADPEVVVKLATIQVCNTYGGEVLGKAIEPLIARACGKEGYRTLPPQAEPFIMNVKGASASGKSTMRSLQQELAGRLGVPWEDFALISPDYWRKFLLDYDSLGPIYKYAGALTGHELALIDQKLDRYMAQKAESGRMSHLLIDRFRFDSFRPEQERETDSKLLTRFGKTIFLFFVVTPPEATVERAWLRGLKTGRFKAVDDLLFHNIEAFTGMPQLFFSWALSKAKRVHYEFLDNSVAEGERPRTIASGWNGQMNVYDVKGMLNIERFKKIDIDASRPEEVYDPRSDVVADNLGFLRQCVERLDRVQFIDPASGETYCVAEKGEWTWSGAGPSTCPKDIAEILKLAVSDGGGRSIGADESSGADGLDLTDELKCMIGRLQ